MSRILTDAELKALMPLTICIDALTIKESDVPEKLSMTVGVSLQGRPYLLTQMIIAAINDCPEFKTVLQAAIKEYNATRK